MNIVDFLLENIITISTLLLFWLPYVVVMVYIAAERRMRCVSLRGRLLQELGFNAAAYAEEEYKRIKKQYGDKIHKDKIEIAIMHMQKADPSVSNEEAVSAIRAILGKVRGAGATANEKVGR